MLDVSKVLLLLWPKFYEYMYNRQHTLLRQLFVLAFLFLVACCGSLQAVTSRLFTTEQGLSSLLVNYLYQDRYGMIWIAHNYQGAPNIQPYHALRPIPQSQIDAMTDEAQKQGYQNPGY